MSDFAIITLLIVALFAILGSGVWIGSSRLPSIATSTLTGPVWANVISLTAISARNRSPRVSGSLNCNTACFSHHRHGAPPPSSTPETIWFAAPGASIAVKWLASPAASTRAAGRSAGGE